MKGLTSRQREILDFITCSIQDNGYPPTIREIGRHMGIRSTNGVNDRQIDIVMVTKDDRILTHVDS